MFQQISEWQTDRIVRLIASAYQEIREKQGEYAADGFKVDVMDLVAGMPGNFLRNVAAAVGSGATVGGPIGAAAGSLIGSIYTTSELESKIKVLKMKYLR